MPLKTFKSDRSRALISCPKFLSFLRTVKIFYHLPQTLTQANKDFDPNPNSKFIDIFSKSFKKFEMGITINDNPPSSHYRTRKVFIFINYILLGAASSCIFLTLSLRLLPSLCGFLLILLHLLTITGAISGCAAASKGSSRWYGAHMAATVLTAIFQGSVSVLIFTRPDDFLHQLKSYVREEDAVVILKLAGGLCVVIFCLEWAVLTLAFFLKYYDYVDGTGDASLTKKSTNNWSYPFQVQV